MIDQIVAVIFGDEKGEINDPNIFKLNKDFKFKFEALYSDFHSKKNEDGKISERYYYPFENLFEEINVTEDVSSGQRGYKRNIDGLLAMMVQQEIDKDKMLKEK